MRYFSIIAISVLLSSCYRYSHQTKNQFEMCYDGQYTGIDTLINVKGYYEMQEMDPDSNHHSYPVVFYKNGLYLHNPQFEIMKNKGFKIKNLGEWWNWGLYKISNDTIICQYIGVTSATSRCFTSFYKIIDYCTIIKVNPLEEVNYFRNISVGYHYPSYIKYSYFESHFVPNEEIHILQSTRLFNEKWFWCDPDSYEQWKRRKKLDEVR